LPLKRLKELNCIHASCFTAVTQARRSHLITLSTYHFIHIDCRQVIKLYVDHIYRVDLEIMEHVIKPSSSFHSFSYFPVAVRICEPQSITSLSGCLQVQFRMSRGPVYGCHISILLCIKA